MKKSSDPDTVYALGVTLLFGTWSIAMVFVIRGIVKNVREQMKKTWGALQDLDGDGTLEAHEVAQQYAARAHWRLQAFINAQAEESILGTALKWTVVLIPWSFYVYVFVVCWDCFDFEAAAAHEIGHLLGLSHPNAKETDLVAGFGPAGQNSYSSLIVEGSMSTYQQSCLQPWSHVQAGIPDGAELSPGGVRPSIMEAFTTHNPSACLFQDDYEALLTLYPVCNSVMPPKPLCEKVAINIGYLRVAVFVLGPFIYALLFSILIHFCVEQKRETTEGVVKPPMRHRLALNAQKLIHKQKSLKIQPEGGEAAPSTLSPSIMKTIQRGLTKPTPEKQRSMKGGLKKWIKRSKKAIAAAAPDAAPDAVTQVEPIDAVAS